MKKVFEFEFSLKTITRLLAALCAFGAGYYFFKNDIQSAQVSLLMYVALIVGNKE